jgi:hypothetical protein
VEVEMEEVEEEEELEEGPFSGLTPVVGIDHP